METFLLNLLKTSLLGSLAILAMLVLKPLWRERYRAKTRCWLWLALAVFLLLPVDFSVKNAPVQAEPPKDYTLFVGTDKTAIQSTDNLFGDMAEKSGQSPAQVRDTIIQRPVTNPEQKTTRYIPVTTILFYGYLAGAAAFLLYQGVSYALFRRTVRRWKRDVARADYAAMLSDTARDLGVSAPEMIVCEAISTPAVTGLLRPRLLLPHERYDVQELRYILRHELCHLKRRDMLLKLVLLAANAMHWFNPVVYLMLRQADEDIELACDSAATDGLELPERAAYSRTLLAAVQSSVRALPATTCFGGTVERLKRRITNVLGAQKKRGLGVVALVLALTLTAGCAVSWGERAQKNDPFGGTTFSVEEAVYLATEARNAVRGFPYAPDTTFRALTIDSEKRVTMFTVSGDEFVFSPMEAASIDKSTFSALFNDSSAEAWSGMSADELISGNQAVWKGSASDATYEDYYNVLYLFAQKDGSFYVGLAYQALGSDSGNKAIEGIGSVYRLIVENTDTIYASMDDYAAERVADLKKSMMTYSVSENNEYGARSIVDTIADVRVTQLEFADSLGNLSPDGTVLELWYFQYEMKPTNEAGMQIDVIGGQELTDDGYLNENWTHYLTVLHYTYGEKTGYQIIGTSMSNDGLWYNGCGYGVDLKYYLHDFYIDYAGLDLPKMYIPDLVDGLVEDGYGHGNSVEGRLVSDSTYNFCYYYVPITGWACSPGTDYWYSRYDTGSYFSVKKLERGINDAKAEWESTGVTGEKVDTGCWRYVTHEGMSNTIVTLFAGPNNTTYEVEIHWLFDGSTEENQWGWNHDRAVEEEAVILQAMVKHFTIDATVRLTQVNASDTAAASTGFDALDAALDALGDMNVTADPLGHAVMVPNATAKWDDRNGTNIAYRAEIAKQFRQYSWKEASNVAQFGEEVLSVQCGRWNFYLYSNYKNVLSFFDQESDPKGYPYAFEITNAGAENAVWDAFYKWYEEAVAADSGKQTVTPAATDTLSRASITKSADSYVDNDGYLWYIFSGKLCRWHEGGAVETICTLPIDSLTDSPVRATLSIMVSRVALRYHIGGATMGTYVTELYNSDGEQYVKIDGYESIAFDNHGNIVKTLQFPPAQNNLSISYDSGKTWTSIGDADYFYGSVTEDGSSISYFPGALEIRDGYVYTTAVYDIDHQKTSDPLVTHSVRVNLKTGAQEILD